MKKEKYFTVAKTISRWKIDNGFENWLSYKADNSDFWKSVYVLFYKIFDYKYYVRGKYIAINEIERHRPLLQNDFGRLSNKWLIQDMIYSLHRFGVDFNEYFVFRFYDLNCWGREKFTSLKLQYGYCELLGQDKYRNLFEDKGLCYERLKKYYKRDLLKVSNTDDKEEFCKFCTKHSSFIYKPLTLCSGKGIRIVNSNAPDWLPLFEEFLSQGPFVVEELICQAQELACLYPNSINTIRVAAIKINNMIKLYGAAIRMGSGGSNIDNAGAGGIYAGVDIKEGIVDTIASDYAGNKYIKHPNTGTTIIGYQLPQWKEAKQLITDAMTSFEEAKIIVWDIAYGKKGWLVVEANDVGGQIVLQGPFQTGIKAKVISLLEKSLATMHT